MTEVSAEARLIEHLDFTPMCEMFAHSCDGTNPATYVVTKIGGQCHPKTFFACSECVTRKIVLGVKRWRCVVCGISSEKMPWLDYCSITPLKGRL